MATQPATTENILEPRGEPSIHSTGASEPHENSASLAFCSTPRAATTNVEGTSIYISPCGTKRKRENGDPIPSREDHSMANLRIQHATKAVAPATAPVDSTFNEDDDDDDEDDDEDDEDDEDDDMESEVSAGGNLLDELEAALEGDFQFQGSYYHASSTPDAPNPCIYIDGLGSVGLPLSVRDAQHIKAVSAQAPYGHGTETVVNTDVRDTWEIEPGRIKFLNPAYTNWITNTVVPMVWKSLGVAAYVKPPDCHLYKMLLYEEGSHFLPHQDTQKEEGMFATIVIVLPSQYSGGQVHLSHAYEKKVVDLSANSMLQTSILAWYIDVHHEVKPVTSGWRLALSYNLVSAPGGPLPSLPNIDSAILHFKHVLHKWRREVYDDEDPDYVAYTLDHQYSALELKQGWTALKGVDAHKINHISCAAEEEGFIICLAQLEHHKSGYPDDDGGSYYKRGRWGRCYYDEDSDDSDGHHSMLEVTDEFTHLEEVFDLDGLKLANKLDIGEENLIPRDPFDGTPDDEEYEGYVGNGAGSLEHYYHRTVMLLLHEDNAFILFRSGGIQYPLKRLRNASNPPTAQDLKWVNLIIPALSSNPTAIPEMVQYANLWNDLDLWRRIMQSATVDLKSPLILFDGWKRFSFDAVRLEFQGQLDKCTNLHDRLSFIRSVQNAAPQGEQAKLNQWAVEQTERVLAKLYNLTVEEIPLLTPICASRGVKFVEDVILPQLHKSSNSLSCCIAFATELHKTKVTNEQSEQSSASLDEIIEKCLSLAVLHWNSTPPASKPNTSYPYYPTPPDPAIGQVDNIISIVDSCLATGHLTACGTLFTTILRNEGSPSDKFSKYYRPLIPKLRAALLRANTPVTQAPFKGFFHDLVSFYLRAILPRPPAKQKGYEVSKVGCGCMDCNALDQFLVSSETQKIFRMAEQRRYHLMSRLTSRKVADTETIRNGSPHGLKVTKRKDAMAATAYKSKRDIGRAFVDSIGDDATLRSILGDQGYEATMQTLERKPSRPAAGQSGSNANSALRGSVSSNRSVPAPVIVPKAPQVSTKKRLVPTGSIIDLTLEE